MGASIWDQSVVPASNTSLNGINLAENCAASGINDAIRDLVAETKGAVTAVTASGTDTYTATLAPAPSALTTGMTIHLTVTNANTSTTPTLNINSLGAKTIVKNGSAALVAGDIPAGHEAVLRYNGTNWVLLNPKTLNGAVLTSRTLTSGNGLTGGGDLSADRTLAVGAGTGIVANADDVAIDKAAQADMEGETSNKVMTADNAKYHPRIAKAWVVFDGTPTGSYPLSLSAAATSGVSGITKNGVGDYTVTWSTAFSSANYAVLLTAQAGSSNNVGVAEIYNGGQVAGSVRIKFLDASGVAADFPAVHALALGDWA